MTVIERSDDAAAATTRFVTMADPEEVKDLHGGGPDGQVKRLHYLVRIFWESELPELGDYLLIPLARLENAGSVKLSRRFIPPSLALDASEPLMRLVKEIRDQLAARGRQLAQCQSQRALQGSPDSPELLPLLALTAVNRQLPYLSHLAEAPSVHPWLAYGALQQLAGELSTFSRKEHPTDQGADAHSPLPPYDHQRLWECFSTAQAAVDRLIDAIAAGPERVVRLVRDGACYSADLKPSLIEEGARFYLGVSSRQERKSLLGSFHAVAKLSAREHLAVLTSRALPGIELQFLEVPPRELPLRSNTLYFAVDHRHDQWSLVAKQKNVALYWDDAPDDLEVDLLVFEQSQR